MTPERTVLAPAIILQAIQFGHMSIVANRDLSPAKTTPDDDDLH